MVRSSTRVLALCLAAALALPMSVQAEETKVRNVIFMIPDGMSVTGTTLTRLLDGKEMALDSMACGLVKTAWAKGPITDSAPAATALASGVKTDNKFIGSMTAEEQKKPIASLMEAARLAGKATGIIATSNIQHATPADFTAHYPDRSKYEILGEQQVYAGLDVVLGGGSQYLEGSKRKDKEDLIGVLTARGYDYVTTPQGLQGSTGSKLWGMFAPDAMAYDMDRDISKEPSLAEMTNKAIEVLSKDPEGFVLMVEGSKVDWAAHANDPIGVIGDVRAFDKAVGVAKAFALRDGHTVVVAVTDHGNGGISIGDAGTTKIYDSAGYGMFLDPLKKAIKTGEGIEKLLNSDRSNAAQVMASAYGISDLTEAELKAVMDAPKGALNSVVGPMISKRAHIGWTTGGHTGEDVVLYMLSPGERLTGLVDNTEIPKFLAQQLGLDLAAADRELFVGARKGFEAVGATVTFDQSDVNSPILIAVKGDKTLKMPINKSTALLNGAPVELNGLTVFNGISVYVPQQAINLLK